MHSPVEYESVVTDGLLSAATMRTRAKYCSRTSKSALLHKQATQCLPGGDTRTVTYFPPHPLFMEGGSGCYITDVDQHRYLDLLNNYTSLIHGHAHPHIVKAVAGQLAKGTAYGAPVKIQMELAKCLSERIPSLERLRFCNSGSEAMMMAVRAAKAYTKRNKIMKIEGGYHGSFDAVEVSVAPPIEGDGAKTSMRAIPDEEGLFRGVLSDIVVAPFNDVPNTKTLIEENADCLAAIIVEPVLGAAGIVPGNSEYLQFLRAASSSCGALLVFDEVVTFRLSYGGAQELYKITPDLTALGKTIGGGLPVGAFGGRADIMSLFDPRQRRMSHSGTFNGNAATMAAGIATLDMLPRREIDRINALGERLRLGLRDLFTNLSVPVQVTGAGSLVQLHFNRDAVVDYRSSARSNREAMDLTHLSLLNHGVFVAPRGLMCISTAMKEEQIDEANEGFQCVGNDLLPDLLATLKVENDDPPTSKWHDTTPER
jgi:glutamate-1-semialdehyde 2,1-aminomutase